MGVCYEFNWYIVIEKQEDIEKIEKNKYKIVKKGQRIYPTDSSLPLIIKNMSCIGLAKILNFKVNQHSTEVEFKFVENYIENNDIGKHYYKMYMSMR